MMSKKLDDQSSRLRNTIIRWAFVLLIVFLLALLAGNMTLALGLGASASLLGGILIGLRWRSK